MTEAEYRKLSEEISRTIEIVHWHVIHLDLVPLGRIAGAHGGFTPRFRSLPGRA
jgi:hypothetical protein